MSMIHDKARTCWMEPCKPGDAILRYVRLNQISFYDAKSRSAYA